jgi:hypothetical protein
MKFPDSWNNSRVFSRADVMFALHAHPTLAESMLDAY